MLEADKSCTEVLQQFSAVISALNSTRVLILSDHMESCIKPALKAGQESLLSERQDVIGQSLKL